MNYLALKYPGLAMQNQNPPARRVRAAAGVFAFISCFLVFQQKPTLHIIGDYTVRNSSGHGGPGLWGWGTFIGDLLDSTKLAVSNQAMAVRSTRTFTSEGRWDRLLSTVKPGSKT